MKSVAASLALRGTSASVPARRRAERRAVILADLVRCTENKISRKRLLAHYSEETMQNFTTLQTHATSSTLEKKEKKCSTRVTCKEPRTRSFTPTMTSDRPSFWWLT